VELGEIIPAGMDPRISAASLTSLEARWSQRGERIRNQIKPRLEAPSDRSGDSGENPELDRALGESVAALEKWLGRLVQDFAGSEDVPKGSEPVTAPAGGDPVASRPMSAGAVLLQYLLASDHLRIVLTASGMQRRYEVSFAEGEVNRLVYELRSALQEDTEWLDSARRLYELLIGPLRSDLDAAGARTLVFSLDGVLRYLPIAALNNGERYLLEDFALMLAAGAPTADGAGPDPSGLRAAGFGVTRAIGPHRELKGVREELDGVIRTDANARGVLPGLIALDETFTIDALRDAIASRHAVIHIVSHFTLNAAQEPSSYLLLGDGSRLTLVDLSELSFDGVELVVLSACDTAMGGGHRQSGREIEGLGALVHRRGARNVIATLWPVRDFTTAAIMRRFYENWCLHKLAPPEALRQAQLSLLRGNDTNPTGPARAIRDRGNKARSNWNHPRFWAPYLLMGQS
jgi:CHAT domain-containing protein